MPKVVLYADDNADDAFLFQHAVKPLHELADFRYVPDGQSAVDWLEGAGPFAHREHFPIPDVLIVDLKMPFGTGMDVLRWIRSKPELAGMRVVIFTGSNSSADAIEAKNGGATAYLTKDPDCRQLVKWLREHL
jgi:CheY-like chemotaxis protein